MIPALNHTLLLWLQDFVRRRWGKLDNLQKISLLWKLSCFYNSTRHATSSRWVLGGDGTGGFHPGDLGSWSWVLDRFSTTMRSLRSPFHLSHLQPICLWNSRAGTAGGRCCHLLSTVPFSTINFIHHHHQALHCGLCFLLTPLAALSELLLKIFHTLKWIFTLSLLCPSPLPCLLFGLAVDPLQEVFFPLVTFLNLLFGPGCPGPF